MSNNMIVTNLNWNFFNSMSAMKSHIAFENNFILILDKHAPKKTKNL